MKLFKIMETAYESFDNSVRSYLAKTFNALGMQYSHSQIFGVIFDGIKGIMQNIMFYIEDAFTEQNIFRASRKQSVYSLAKISGYDPYYGSSATGTLQVKVKISNGLSSKSSKIYIKNGETVINKSTGLLYSIYLPTDYYIIDLSKPLVTHELKLVQGNFTKGSYVAKGYNLETIHVTSTNLFDKDYIKVKVDGIEYEQVGSLYDMTTNDNQYILTTGYDNAFDIMFGNDVYGKKLKEGQTIIVEYLVHLGTSGNISTSEQYDLKFNNYCYDSFGENVDANKYINLSIKNCISGGSNSDTIEFVRSNIGMNSRSLVLASEDNFKLFFKRFSFIGYINCWSEVNSMIVTTSCLKNIKDFVKENDDYYRLNVKNLLLDEDQKDMIQNTLNNSKKAFAGITLKFEDPIIRKFAIICYVKPDNIYNKDMINQFIKDRLADYFIRKIDSGNFIAKSDLINLLTTEDSHIEALDIDIISELAEQTYKNGYYDKYELQYINGTYKYVTKRIIYEESTNPGLDNFGNISLDSKLEFPVLSSFDYYTEKGNDKETMYKIPAVQIMFI